MARDLIISLVKNQILIIHQPKKLKAMKKLIQLIPLVGMVIAPMSQDAKSFIQRYTRQDGFSVVTIGKPAMKMISHFIKASE